MVYPGPVINASASTEYAAVTLRVRWRSTPTFSNRRGAAIRQKILDSRDTVVDRRGQREYFRRHTTSETTTEETIMAKLAGVVTVLTAGALAAGVSGTAVAQSYPTKPIELVSPTSAGSGTDIYARALADIVQKNKLLPQPFLVFVIAPRIPVYPAAREGS
jgi:hypothetical protein